MDSNRILLIVMVIHVVLVIAYFALFVFTRRSRLRKEYWIPVMLVPIAGIAMAFLIEYLLASHHSADVNVDMAEMTLGTDIYWKNLRQSMEDTNVVPLEEALVINDVRTRRKILLDTMFTDPSKYLNLLAIARQNEDPETTHYATTTISKIQSAFQLELQQTAVAHEANPEDPDILQNHIDVLIRYIDSGLLEDYLLTRQRQLLGTLLDRRLAQDPNNRLALVEKLRNHTILGQFNQAQEVSNHLIANWPDDESTWLESLRFAVESKDSVRLDNLRKTLRGLNIAWSRAGYDQVHQWLEVDR